MLQIQFDDSAIIVEDGFIGPGYAIQSEKGNEAVDLFAQTEGIMLDDVYTGKAAAGLIHYARADRFGKNENVLFIHTGGNAGQYY
jgi:1-aminocyclopropane-1-carboxylate deaminase/D-cysteine desulfhydrase-like pyridoxal-dependent ACC family enzyme